MRGIGSNHVSLTGQALEFLNGELLGDGYLSYHRISSSYQHSSKHKNYLEWLSRSFAKYGIEQAGKISRYQGVNGTFYFCYRSRRYAELKSLQTRWYKRSIVNPKRKNIKVVPLDLKLAPLTCRQWYIGDGNLYNKYITLNTQGFSTNQIIFLVNLLVFLGFKTTHHVNKVIHIAVRSTRDFLSYIGPCPRELEDVYGYKWII